MTASPNPVSITEILTSLGIGVLAVLVLLFIGWFLFKNISYIRKNPEDAEDHFNHDEPWN